jgi:hypothetical protein
LPGNFSLNNIINNYINRISGMKNCLEKIFNGGQGFQPAGVCPGRMPGAPLIAHATDSPALCLRPGCPGADQTDGKTAVIARAGRKIGAPLPRHQRETSAKLARNQREKAFLLRNIVKNINTLNEIKKCSK